MDPQFNLNFSLLSPKPTTSHLVKFDPSLFQMEISQTKNTTCCISNNHYNKRHEIISFILQLSHKLDPFLSYLAIDYLHRFILNHPIVNQESKPWILRLLAVSCVSLALKMSKTKVLLNNIQREGGVMFEKQSVRRMELLILGSLRWQMRPITPFCFLTFFLSFSQLKHPPLNEALKARATQIILNLQQEMKISEFRPSIVAASALLLASHELFPLQCSSFKDSISTCSYVNKADLSKCNEVMEELATESYGSMLDTVSSSNTTNSPVNVLDGEWSSSSSSLDYSTSIIEDTAVNAEGCRDLKRRKMSISSETVEQCL